MNLRELELFGTLMRVGTTIETARVLGISQPGVSAQIKRLESKLGFALFHRVGNRLEPTAEALSLFDEASPIFSTHLGLLERLESLRNSANSPVTVSATPALLEGFLAERLVAAGYEGWATRLRVLVSEPEEDVRLGRADIGMQMAVPAKAQFQSTVVKRLKLLALLREDHRLAAHEQLELMQLAGEPLVSYEPHWSPMGAAIQRAFRQRGLPFQLSCDVPFCTTVCTLVEACGGLGIIDEFTAGSNLSPRLRAIPVVDLAPISLVVFHRRDTPLRTAVRDLLNVLLRSLGNETERTTGRQPGPGVAPV